MSPHYLPHRSERIRRANQLFETERSYLFDMKKPWHLPGPSEAQIRARWQWDEMPVVASRANIALAVRRTRQSYGLAMNGRPYVAPVVGMAVETHRGKIGEIVEVRKPM